MNMHGMDQSVLSDTVALVPLGVVCGYDLPIETHLTGATKMTDGTPSECLKVL